MAEDRTLAPTPRRRLDAQRRGESARSADLTTSIVFLGGILLIAASAAAISHALVTILRQSLELHRPQISLLAVVLVPLLGAMVLAIVASLAQSGFIIQPRPMQFSARRRSSFHDVLIAAAKFCVLLIVAYKLIASHIPQFFAAGGLSGKTLFQPAVQLGVAFCTMGAIDYVVRRILLERRLKMSRREQLQEIRDTEGDPAIRSRRRQIAARGVTQRRAGGLKEGDVLIAAPPSLLVALRYQASRMPAPIIVTIARGQFARDLHESAEARGIKIVQQAALARTLSRLASGSQIPESLFQSIADVFARVGGQLIS